MSLIYKTFTAFTLVLRALFYLSGMFRGAHSLCWGIIRKKKEDKGARKKRSSYCSRRSQSREIRCRACVLTVGPLRRRISIAGHFCHIGITWLPAVIYFVPNYDSGTWRDYELNPTTLSQPCPLS